MYKGKRFIAIIPARGGSKGIPDKNIMDIDGTPLIAYSILAAQKSKYIDKVIISTDSQKIAEVSQKYGADVPFIRPDELASDTARSVDVVIHCVDFLKSRHEKYDFAVLLQPTSPLRGSEDIDSAIEKLAASERESLVSVCEASENPYLMRTINDERLHQVLEYEGSLRRQDLPVFYIFNGAVYITSVEMLLNEKRFVNDDTLPFVMDRSNSIDIDTMLDAKIASVCIKERKNVQDR